MAGKLVSQIDTADFYFYEDLLSEDERTVLHDVRKFMTTDVQPLLLENWSKATFPFEIVPGCVKPSAGPVSSWAATESCSTITSAAVWPTPKLSTPTKAHAR